MTLSIEERQEICRLKREGYTQKQIAKKCGCHPNTVYNVLNAEVVHSHAASNNGLPDDPDNPIMQAIKKELQAWQLSHPSGSIAGLVIVFDSEGNPKVQAAEVA